MRFGLIMLAAVLVACPEETPAGDPAANDVSDTVDASEDVAPDADVAPPAPTPCELRCQPFDSCGQAVVEACQTTCDDVEVAACEDACLDEDSSCERATACFGVLPDSEPVTWSTGPYGTGFRDTADEFLLPTVRGDWSFAAEWTGHDSYVFAMTQTGFAASEQMWLSQAYWWLQDSPRNVHYFFVSYHSSDGVDDALDNVAAQKLRIDTTLMTLGESDKPLECHWRRRIHYVTVSGWSLDNWLGAWLQETPVLGLAIDRQQRLRPIGLLSLVGGDPLLAHLRYPPAYYNFELERDRNAYTGPTTTVTVFDGEAVNSQTLDVELPSAAEMATFDTLEVDISQYCDAHDDANCFEWDYKAFLQVRERPVLVDNPNADTPCQPASDGVEADALPCDCAVPGAAGDIRTSQQVCVEDGSGFGDCQCNEAWEIVRWITTYNREGRWVVDASAFLPLLDGGGTTRLRFKGAYPYNTTLHLNFSNRGKPDRAVGLQKLFTGGSFRPGYSEDWEPLQAPIPAGTKRAEIVAFITGHGGGGNHNCAEFCNHVHHFTVDGGTPFVYDQPYVGNYYGCAEQLGDGVVPNQFGTWTIGRGGWCPGLEVKPFVADLGAVSDSVSVTYRGFLDGWEEGDPGFSGEIWMNSYLVTYE